jgi:hypothetical protein
MSSPKDCPPARRSAAAGDRRRSGRLFGLGSVGNGGIEGVIDESDVTRAYLTSVTIPIENLGRVHAPRSKVDRRNCPMLATE